ncbi:MAG: hypothetical protein KGZ80_11840 [Methylomonas sp.]|nr:hypothetical protein [Methylomonas sp.]PPD19273.1 MAG: hypothetical protein CTY23_12190 [Methylomonas sp.]PPD24094.1 MAG: hypothetical protein CTY22_11520 [Methylomonas sp.]PPD32597.1 MAG: hypothetical protein CTY21_11445 [Methylomonas sp.]PPD54891.1 MAG: hypothetical protein CTY11_02655 [Methylomonas sp.]
MQLFKRKIQIKIHLLVASVLLTTLTGCLHWYHALQTYYQLKEFDHYFSVSAKNDFTIHFKEPRLLSEDFVSLARLQSSSEEIHGDGKKWRYWFRKIDQQGQQVVPEISFYLDLAFNKDDKITDWTFSPLFLQIAPPEFLEASFRSLGSAEINEGKQQLRARADQLEKISAQLPKKQAVIEHLGEPLEIENEDDKEIYKYQFRLDARDIEEGYEDRALSEVRLSFDKKTAELVRMSGRFAGLKISINYRDYQETESDKVAGL